MGQVFQRTYRGADGTARTCRTWTVRYYRNGRPLEESTKFTRKGDAKNLLQLREGKIAEGVPISPRQFKLTFDEAAQTVVNDYTANGKKSLAVVQRRIDKHLLPYFGGIKLSDISAAHVLAYIAHRQAQGIVAKDGTRRDDVSNAEINRELQVLKRCFSLAVKHGRLFARPSIELLSEAPARAGFLDRGQVDAICQHLPAALAPVIRFAFVTGWRIPSEVLTLEWRQVDLAAGEVRLDPGMTKNGEGRIFKLTDNLRILLEAQQREHERLKKAGRVSPLVFFRLVAKGRGGTKQPKPITSFIKAWRVACTRAGCPGRIPHDLRRSAIRAFVRGGISEGVAMKLSGHRTRSVFDRYAIVSETDLTDAAAKLNTQDRDSSVTAGQKRAARGSRLKRIS